MTPPPFRRFLWAALIVCVSLVVILSLKRWAVEGYEVPTTSMMPTFRPGDRVWVNKLAYLNQAPARGDIVVFPQPGTGILYVKRVIGLPGERVSVLGRQVYVGGEKIETLSATVDTIEPGIWGAAWDSQTKMAWATMPDTGAHYRLLLHPPTASTWRQSGTWKVPHNTVLVLGDSRDDSSDSRSWGPVPMSALVGQVVCRVDAGARASTPLSMRTNCSPDAPL